MRRVVVIGALAGAGILVLRARMPGLQARAMAHCEGMFERMPDTFPPKRMLRGIEDTQARTARIEQLLELRADEPAGRKLAGVAHDAT